MEVFIDRRARDPLQADKIQGLENTQETTACLPPGWNAAKTGPASYTSYTYRRRNEFSSFFGIKSGQGRQPIRMKDTIRIRGDDQLARRGPDPCFDREFFMR